MKTFGYYAILFDDACPMCTLASRQLVRSGLIAKNKRQRFSEAQQCNLYDVDWSRGRNEVPVVNTTDHTVQYGVDGLISIITQKAAWLGALLRLPPVWFVIRKLYVVVAYNRRVIMPGRIFEDDDPIAPTMNYPLRWTYIILAWMVTSAILVAYSAQLTSFIPPTNFLREFLVCGGQIVVQGALVMLVRKERRIHYLGNMMTISLAGALLLLPMLFVGQWIDNSIVSLTYFALVVFLMFMEHVRRVKRLELPRLVSGGWVMYRVLVLGVILYL